MEGLSDAGEVDLAITKGGLEERRVAGDRLQLGHDAVGAHSHFMLVGNGDDGLCFGGRGAAIPEFGLAPSTVEKRGGVAAGRLMVDAKGQRRGAREGVRGHVTEGAGDNKVRGEAAIEEEQLAEIGLGLRVRIVNGPDEGRKAERGCALRQRRDRCGGGEQEYGDGLVKHTRKI